MAGSSRKRIRKEIKMAHKFKINDEVRFVKQIGKNFPKGFKIGDEGKIVDYNNFRFPYSYEVKKLNGKINWFRAGELKKITEAVKMNLPKTIYIQERDESDGFFISGTPEELSEEGIKVKVGKYKLEKVVTIINEIKVVE